MKIGIIGYGFVGEALSKGLKNDVEIFKEINGVVGAGVMKLY